MFDTLFERTNSIRATMDQTRQISKFQLLEINLDRLTGELAQNKNCNADLSVVSVEEVKGRLKKIEDLWNEFDEAQLVLEIKLPGPTRETDRTEFENSYFKYTAEANEIIKNIIAQTSGTGQNETIRQQTIALQLETENELIRQRTIAAQLEVELNTQRNNELIHMRALAASRALSIETSNVETPIIRNSFPLPRLDLPTFSGGYEEWLGFRDLFTAIIHDDKNIPKVQKLRYLKSYLKDNAARVIENIEISEASYDVAWNLLEERFDNKRLIINNHMMAILELSSPNNHSVHNCSEFSKLNVEERIQMTKKKGLCYNCLGANHMIEKCVSRNCSICHKRHHTLLHREFSKNSGSELCGESREKNIVKSNHVTDSSMVLLSTAIVNVVDANGKRHICRVLLDSGSQPNLMTEEFANKLNLKKHRLNSAIEVLSDKKINSVNWVETMLESNESSYASKLSFLVLPKITSEIPSIPIDKNQFSIPSHIRLADPNFHRPAMVDILLGAELFYDLLGQNKISLAVPHVTLQDSRLGWIVTGKLNNNSNQPRLKCNLVRDPLTIQLEKFWNIEEGVKTIYLTKEESDCEKHFSENVQRDHTGRYIVRLAFNKKIEQLGDSYDVARRRFFMLERRFARDEKLKKDYQTFMQQYEDLGHMEPSSSGPEEGYYIPHHAVIKEASTTTKLRVVFDGSSKTDTGISLNETLLVGPTIQTNLFALLMRFRQHPVGLSADIEKMYRQFWIHPDDRKFQKILWRKNQDSPIKTYQLKTVTYGTSAAPFLAIRCLKELAKDEGANYPEAARTLEEDFYVDDALTGSNTVEEAQQLQGDLIQLTQRGGLHLCKWRSNKLELIENSSDPVDSDLRLDLETSSKTLGVMWNTKLDTLYFKVTADQEKKIISKRSMLSKIAKVYDPCGLIAPVITSAKIKMQELWKTGTSWDDPVPPEILEEFELYQGQLHLINEWSLERAVRLYQSADLQLHGFADASEKAYGACIYVRTTNDDQHRSVLLCARSRVAPLKVVTLPRLELCASVLLTKLLNTVKDSLRCKIDKIRLWSDSMIVLSWIKSSPHQFNTFVANRVAEIQESTNASMWGHVRSEDNPADVISRGQMPRDFITNAMWKSGPEWLQSSEENWPNHGITCKELPERKKNKVMIVTDKSARLNLWSRYSSLSKLINVVAYCLRFLRKTKGQNQFPEQLTPDEISEAYNRIIFLIQRQEFPDEIRQLEKGEELTKRSKLRKLKPIIHEELLKVGGRIKKSLISSDKKQPILLPKTHPVTDLIIRDTHEKNMHSGVNGTLYALREKFWIIDGRVSIRRILNLCVKCFRVRPKEVSYAMADLPRVRVTPARPFENCGVDYCGPFFVKEKQFRNRNKVKVYAAVFVCMSTKAIHVELVGDLSTEKFLGCLKRFFARRGKSKRMYSDNGTNFVGAKNELDELYGLLNAENHNREVARTLANQNIEWHFSPPRTPHFGGIWEAAVKSLKTHLRRTIGEILFTYEELYTYMCEVEAILNSRPLTPISNDPNDMDALTPSHFLIGSSMMTIPSLDFSQTPTNRLSSWQLVQKLKSDLWKRWNREYLNELNVRSKWHTGSADIIKLGTLVVLRDDNLPPLRWSLGRVIELLPGDDGIIRVVRIKTQSGTCIRGVKKVSPLPVE
ncbi:uncharacterized protein LOC127284527 [Leptopilina boulardi]|uniref:uncharacterized protein LOC127284527 n=1 Tax=Leptopilina boulardi TaxID=63433 RepID=UPI0021F52F4C|nr:uncharacterized protein LOC127284527 [Leptopilina boulardi]